MIAYKDRNQDEYSFPIQGIKLTTNSLSQAFLSLQLGAVKPAPFLRFDKRAWAGSIIDNELRRRGIRPHEVMELDSLQAALMMVEHGLGITIMPINQRKLPALSDRFRLLPFGQPQLQREVGVYQRRHHPHQGLLDVFIRALRSGFDDAK